MSDPGNTIGMISVVVPVYNAEKFLRGTVQSILEQTDPDYEIVLINDGSTDRSLEVCRELEREDERIHVYDQPNRGVSAARNEGARLSGGDYISYVDSDDRILPTMIADLRRGMEEMLSKGHVNVQVQIGRKEIDEEGNDLPNAITPPGKPEWIDPVTFLKGMLLYTGDASFCTKLTPRKLILAYPFEEGALAEDFGLQARLTPVLEGIYSLPHVDYVVLHRAGSLTRRKDIEHFSKVYISIVEASDYVERELVPLYPELKIPAEFFSLYERLDYMLHVPISDMQDKNRFYQDVVAYLRKNRGGIKSNPYLKKKDRIYLRLLSAAPVAVRKIHRLSMLVRGIH